MKLFLTLLLLAVHTLGDAQSHPPVSLPATEIRSIKSSILNGETYQLLVHFPQNYKSTERYNVLFTLDGIDNFPLAIACLGILHGECGNEFAEPLLIGISDGSAINTPGNKRDRDYTPTAFKTSWGGSGGGGAPAFLQFIEQEVIPFVDKNYPVTKNRALYGYSYGGLFASYALLTKPELFKKVLIGSPSVWADDEVIVRQFEPEFAKTHSDLPVDVWLSVGEKDDNLIDGEKKLAAVLQSRNYPSLRLKTIILPGLNHLTGIHPTMLQAFKWAYCQPE